MMKSASYDNAIFNDLNPCAFTKPLLVDGVGISNVSEVGLNHEYWSSESRMEFSMVVRQLSVVAVVTVVEEPTLIP